MGFLVWVLLNNGGDYLNKGKFYKCYSIKLFHFLKDNGLWYVHKDYNHETKKNYWLFEKNERLQELLDKWKENRPVNNK